MNIDNNKNKFNLLYFFALLLILVVLHSLFFTKETVQQLKYAEFKQIAQQPNRIRSCFLSNVRIYGIYIKDNEVYQQHYKDLPFETVDTQPKQSQPISFLFKKSQPGEQNFSVIRVHDDPNLIKFLEENHIPFQGEVESDWVSALFTWILPLLLIVVFWVFIFKRMNMYGKDIMSFGKNSSKIRAEANTKTTFKDVAGCDEAKEELEEIVEFLKSPQKFEQLGGKIPKGALLVGPPGTGKTLLARAVAGEAGVPFFNISGSEFVEMFVGVGASRVRDLFQQAKSKPPCIIFIDEIDAVGRQRGSGIGGGHDEREQTLNQLLSEMDGFETNKGIIVFAATNRPDILDSALLRPGRFDRRITIDQPDLRGREEILKIHSKGKPLASNINLKQLAQRMPGFSGAELASVMNEAALLAARKNQTQIEQENIAEAIERVMAGPQRKSRILSQNERIITAVHEVGHAMIAELHPYGDPVHKVSIIPRGSALGYTLSIPEEDKYNRTKEELIAKICCSLSGRIAEEVCFNICSTGAKNDFEHVTDLARSIIARYGMSKTMGPMVFAQEDKSQYFAWQNKNVFSETTLTQLDQEVHDLVIECYNYSRGLLEKYKNVLETIAAIMIEKETVEGDEFRHMLHSLIPDLPAKNTRVLSLPAVTPEINNTIKADSKNSNAEIEAENTKEADETNSNAEAEAENVKETDDTNSNAEAEAENVKETDDTNSNAEN